MNIWKISIKNIKAKLSYTVLSVFILALSISLLLGIKQLKNSFEYQIENNLGDIDLVIGAKGSPLQLILSSVLHLDNPTGNISFADAQKISKNPLVKRAVPISYGDNYKGYRIIGTKTKDFMSLYDAEIEEGRSVEKNFEVIIGSSIVKKLNLNVGDTFLSSHGLIENEIDVHDTVFTIVGILKPTQKVIDRVIICPLATVWEAHEGHDHDDDHDSEKNHVEHHEDEHDEHEHDDDEHHEENNEHEYKENHQNEEHDEHDHDDEHHELEESHNEHEENDPHNDHDENKEITAMLISFKNLSALLTLPRRINEDTNMQAALPKYELKKLYRFTGVGLQTISWIAYLILFISGVTIFISLYKMVKERAFDLALLRTYGASNTQLIKMVSYEGLIIAFTAFISGFVFTKVGLGLLTNFLDAGYQQTIIRPLPINQVFEIIGMVLTMIVLSIIFAIYPIIKMNISTILSNEK